MALETSYEKPVPVRLIAQAVSGYEGLAGYDVRWPWTSKPMAPGITAVLRVKNEARSMPWVLPPILDATQHVVLVDNTSGSSPRTWCVKPSPRDPVLTG